MSINNKRRTAITALSAGLNMKDSTRWPRFLIEFLQKRTYSLQPSTPHEGEVINQIRIQKLIEIHSLQSRHISN